MLIKKFPSVFYMKSDGGLPVVGRFDCYKESEVTEAGLEIPYEVGIFIDYNGERAEIPPDVDKVVFPRIVSELKRMEADSLPIELYTGIKELVEQRGDEGQVVLMVLSELSVYQKKALLKFTGERR